MRRVLAVLLVVVVVGLAGGFVWLGAFPPAPPLHPVHEIVSNAKLAPS